MLQFTLFVFLFLFFLFFLNVETWILMNMLVQREMFITNSGIETHRVLDFFRSVK